MVNPAVGAPAGVRTAFALTEAHVQRAKNHITCVAVSHSAEWLYVGLSDGQLEEHRLEITPSSVRTSLSARKTVSKKPLEEIHHLVGARQLAVLSDGAVSLLDCDNLEKTALSGVKGVTAVTAEPSDVYPSRLAVATKVVVTTRKHARVLLYKVRSGSSQSFSGGGGGSTTAMLVKQLELMGEGHSLRRLAWCGGAMVAATHFRYVAFSLRDGALTPLFDLPAVPGGVPRPPTFAAFPASGTAMLLMERVGMVVDESGAPTGGTLLLTGEPLAFAQCGIYVLALTAEGVTVYDQTSSAAVQSLPCKLQEPGLAPWACAASSAGGACVVVATHRRVLVLRPIGLEDQARELLRLGQFEAADALAGCCGPGGGPAPWRDVLLAEAALLQLAELRFEEALASLRRVPLSVLPPAALFPLFPEAARTWLPGVGAVLWGVAPPLGELGGLVRAALGHGASEADVEEAVRAGKACVATYLAEIRERSGAKPADGIDTLLARLYVDTEAVGRLEALVAGANLVAVGEVEAVLEGAGRSHALALLLAEHQRQSAAAAIWRELADGARGEAPADTGAIAEAAAAGSRQPQLDVAVRCVKELLLGRYGRRRGSMRAEVPSRLALQHLPWLLDSGEGAGAGRAGLEVARAQALPVREVLAMLRARPDRLRWRYLLHVVQERGEQDAALHTELALVLSDAVLAAAAAGPPSFAAVAARPEGPPDEMVDDLGRMRGALQAFLEASARYDVPAVLHRLQGTSLWAEQVVLHGKTGNHGAALRLLAINIHDTRAALQYCEKAAAPGCHLLLLRILLAPGEGQPPRLQDACLVLNSPGGSELDPLEVLDAMSPAIPLAQAMPTLARMLRERIHRARDRRLVSCLQRSVNLEAKGELAEAKQRRVVVGEDRACPSCHARIGARMFALLPDGRVQCYRCFQRQQPQGAA
eukprot:jgi/Tetstr1/455540/TSEL_042362.t1